MIPHLFSVDAMEVALSQQVQKKAERLPLRQSRLHHHVHHVILPLTVAHVVYVGEGVEDAVDGPSKVAPLVVRKIQQQSCHSPDRPQDIPAFFT